MWTGGKKFVLIALFTALLIVLVNLAWWFYYKKTEQLLEDQLARRLSAAAAAGSALVSSDDLDALVFGDLETVVEVASNLSHLQQADSLAEVFIIDENYRYLASTHVTADTIYLLAGVHSRYIDSLFYRSILRPLTTQTYESGGILLKTAFAPLLDSEGIVTAVLGVEASVDYFDVLSDLRLSLWYATALSLLGGLMLGVVFMILQRRINRAEQQLFLNQTHAYLGRMVAVVAHELKNPLMIIRGSAERIAKQSDSQEASYLVEEVDRLNQIVSGYLDFARADRPLLATEPREQFDLVELIGNVRTHFTQRFTGQDIQWVSEELQGPVNMTGYPRSLRQVLLNLLFNGAEACLSVGKEIAVGVQIADRGSMVRLTVIDSGPGFEPGEVKRAFEPFQTSKQRGSGLGLYLSRKLITEMGGDIEIEPEAATGAKVVIELPKEPKN
jgi:signal transduction histidine kinase